MLRFAKYFTFSVILVTTIYLLVLQPRQQQADITIGGDFTLTDQNGNIVTNDSLKGKPRLVYFGFTFCPDICPTALVAMTQATQALGAQAPQLVFITVDPQRDTVAQLHDFAANFPGLIALTGSAESIKQAARAYRVYYQKAEASVTETGYMVDHSSFIYLMDSQGKYLSHFAHDIRPLELEKELRKALTLSTSDKNK